MNDNIIGAGFFDTKNEPSLIMMYSITIPHLVIKFYPYENFFTNSIFILTSLDKKEIYYNV